MAVIKITKENFEAVAKNGEKAVLIDFYATWCGPCKMLSPIVEKIADEHSEYIVGKVNVDDEPELARAFGITSIPMLAVIKDGKVANTAVGYMPEEKVLSLFAE